MRILVTGGAGFIGAHICRKLNKLKHDVVCIDNYSSGYDSFNDNPDIGVVVHDVINPLPTMGAFDIIFHLACPASPIQYQKNQLHTLRTCSEGTYNVMEYALEYNSTVIFTSTSEVYGDPQVHPQPEHYCGNVSTTTSRSCYDEGKRAAETICHIYKQQHNMDVRVARLFNTYGPGMYHNDGRVVSNFIVQCLTDKALTIYGSGTQTRSFCHVNDTVSALIKMGFTNRDLPATINIGNPHEITIKQLAQSIGDICQVELQHNTLHCDLPDADPTQRKPDITLAREYLGWNPTVSLHEGLLDTIEYFKQHQDLL